ncbi:MAG: class I SAM-dependent methyltransferase [Candidatus Pacebacteria bacterium]|jgi:ubiquinone/menaquinone biosynthesis C-methylase UbiE|nr:class I SAM-dependent methyltransferase [Candidatus Paceibacterota bacterium]MDP7466461.1 class I SAM-dependent methyltransferase [Candidatus Paceibacterota bacterium]
MTYTFSSKWADVAQKDNENSDEKSIFVNIGDVPVTQRQLDLYYYFLFIKNILNKINAKNVLEVGCGRGTISLYIKKYLHIDMTLIDNVPDALEIAKNEFNKHGETAEFYIEDALKANLPDNKFDATVSIGLAEHFESVNGLFKEQYRVLKDGGVMISLNIPKKFSIQFLNKIMKFIKKNILRRSVDIRKDYYRNSLSSKDYKKSALNAGFKKVEIVHVCPLPIYAPISIKTDRKVAKFNKFVLKIRSIFQKYPYKTNKLFAQAHFLVAYK